MTKIDGTSEVNGTQERDARHLLSVTSPVAHQGILDALRRAYDGPVCGVSDEFNRLLAHLN